MPKPMPVTCVVQLSYFDDPIVRSLSELDEIELRTAEENYEFFNRLSECLCHLPTVGTSRYHSIQSIANYCHVNVRYKGLTTSTPLP